MNSFLRLHIQSFNLFRHIICIISLLATGQFVGYAQNLDSLKLAVTKTKDPVAKVTDLVQIAAIYQSQKDDTAFNSTVQQALRYSLESKNDTIIASVYSIIGSFYEDKSDFTNAIEFHLKSLNILESLHYDIGICVASENLAVVYKQLKKLDESLKYLNKAKSYINLPEIKQSYLPRAIYANLAETFFQLDSNTDSALIYIQKANEVVDRNNDQFGYSRILTNFAIIYSAKGDNDLAETYFKKAIAYSDSTNQKINYVTSLKEYAIFLQKHNQPQVAKKYSLIAFSEVAKMPNEILKLETAKTAASIFGELRQYDSAFYFSTVKDSLQNSILGNEKLNAIQTATYKQQLYETEQAAIRLKESEDRKHTLQYLFIGFCLIAIFTLFILFSHSILFNSTLIKFFGAVALLLIFEFINLLIHPFLEKITSHSPMFIFLILVLIAALLVPLHHTLEKYIIEKMITRNTSIRQKKAIRIINQSKE
jgi:tetratricopeptide (TPR) repeat protein